MIVDARCAVCGDHIGYVFVNKPIYDKSGLKKSECIKTMRMDSYGMVFEWLCDTCASNYYMEEK